MAVTWKKLAYADNVILKSLLTEQGDIIYASAASTPAALAHGTSTQYLKSGGHGANPSWDTPVGGGATVVPKTADEGDASAVLQNDAELLFAVAANEKWQFILVARTQQASAVARVTKYTFAIPTASALKIMALWTVDGGAVEVNIPASTNTASVAPGAIGYLQISLLYIGGANGGNVQFQWCGVNNTYTANVLANSYIVAHKLA